jgi:hypothetical protein
LLARIPAKVGGIIVLGEIYEIRQTVFERASSLASKTRNQQHAARKVINARFTVASSRLHFRVCIVPFAVMVVPFHPADGEVGGLSLT